MSRRGSDLVLAAPIILLLSASFAAGCKRDEPAEQKQQLPPTVEVIAEATAAPTEAAPQVAPSADQYDDSLVLLAEGEPDTGPAPLVVQFQVESLVVDEISGPRYTWDFGDGSPRSDQPNPTHTYEKPGDYTATVGVVDASGEHGWDEVDILVEEPEDQDSAP